MLSNAEIADRLEQLADLLEFQGANAFRIRAYRNATRTIRTLPTSLAQLVTEDPRKLTEIDGIGKAVAEKCTVLIQTGRLPQLEDLLQEIPESVLTLLRIPGLGPKKAAVLYRQLGITTLAELEAACGDHRVRELKGFGAKTEAAILKGIGLAQAAGARIYWADADEIVQQLRSHLERSEAVEKLAFAGSYRRGKETVGDLDILVVSMHSSDVMDQLAAFPAYSETFARGDTKMSIRLDTGLQVDLRVVPDESFGAALQYFTGSKQHNVVLRGRAKQHGLKINEYGVFRVDGEVETYIAGRTEADVYGALHLPVFAPESREARQEFLWADAGPLPELVCLEQIRGDLHMHTTATDGLATLEEMVSAAQQRGLDYVAITDHSQRVTMAHGLDPKRLLAQWAEIDAINEKLGRDFRVLKGIEVDILEDGRLDLPDDILAQSDWAVASIHYGQRQSQTQITGRLIGALAHPHVSAIAHPTGRLLNRRAPYDVDMDAVLAAAAKYGKIMELNAHPMRLDLNDVHCTAAKSRGVPIVISTDAHSTDGLQVMRFGVLQARRGGLTAADVANTRSWPQLKRLLKRG